MTNSAGQLIWNESGTATLETSLIAFLLIVIPFSVAEFGNLWLQWNSAEKATQMAVRQAVTSDPVATELATFSCGNAATLPGTACSTAGASSFGTITCSGSSRSCTAGYAFDGTQFDRMVALMKQVDTHVTGANVVIEYRDVGLGFAGRARPIPLVSVRLVNMTYSFYGIAFLMGDSIAMPDFRATLTGEDLTTGGAG